MRWILVRLREDDKYAPAPVPIKCGIYGPQGSGKSTSAALMAAAIAVEFYNRAPVYVVDPEAAWQFLKRRIFDVEGIELIQRPYSSFKDMVDSLHEAEKLGACCWIVDPLTLIWNEQLDSFQQKLGYIPIDKWQDVRQLWNGERKTRLVKVGTKFKAGGGESFGYEPHLLLELSLERKTQGQRPGAGRRRSHGPPGRRAAGQNLGIEWAHPPVVGQSQVRDGRIPPGMGVDPAAL